MLITSRFFWVGAVFALALILIFALYNKFFLEKGHNTHKVMLGLYAMYLGFLFVLVLFPTYMLRPFRFSTGRVNLRLFNSIGRLRTNPIEPIGNLILFIPFGFFSVLNDHVKAGRRLWNATWRTAVVSTSMELMQLFIGRCSDIDDVVTNTLGGLIGAAMCVIWHKTRLDHTPLGEKLMPELPKRWRGRLAIPLLSVILLVCYGTGLYAANAIATYVPSREYNVSVAGRSAKVSLQAESALLWDIEADHAVMEVNADTPVFPASMVKLVVSLTALDIAGEDDRVTAGTEILRVPFDCSRAGISMGCEYSLRELIAGALLPSGADACYTIATHCGRILLSDSEASESAAIAAFIKAANAKLAALGAGHTTILNVEGVDEDGQMTTANDLRIIAAAVLDDPVLAEICATGETEIGPEDTRITLRNTNLFVRRDSDRYAKNFIGIKTGSTSRAGNCLVSAFEKNGKRYICVVMHSGYEGKFDDTLKLAGIV